MERYQLDAQTAFNVLVRTSQHAQLKLAVIAEELTSSGRLRRE